MNKPLLILSFLICIYSSGFSQQNGSISIGIAGSNAPLKPGSIQTIIYKIKNNTDSVLQLQPKVRLPGRWRLISRLMYITLGSQGQQILIVSFTIPSQYPAGTHKISLKLVDINGNGDLYGSIGREVQVKEEAGFTLEHVKSPSTVKAGEVINASFIIRNTGNIEQTFTVLPSNCQVKGSNKVKLKPGESSIINVEVETNKDITNPNRQSFYLKVVTPNGLEQQLYNHVNIIPVIQTTNDLYHRFPISITSRFLTKGKGGNYLSGYQFSVAGSGSLDPEGKHQLEFLMRGPNQFDLSLLGLYDQYYIHYNNKSLDISLGDKSYGLTPLTEFGRYGSGVESKFRVNKHIQAGFFYVKPRFYNKSKGELGIYSGIRFSKGNKIGVNFLRKEMVAGHGNVLLYSITSELKPLPETSVGLEIAGGTRGGNPGYACRLNVNSQFSKFSLSSNYFNAGRTFPGYYYNATFYTGSLNYQATNWFSAGVNARQDFSNAELDTLYSTAPYSRQYMALANFKLGKRLFLKAYLSNVEKKDRMEQPKFHYRTTSMNINVSHRMNQLSYRLAGAYGKSVNFLLPVNSRKKNTFRAAANFSYKVNQNIHFSTFVSYSNVNSFIALQQKDWIFGLNGSGSITENLSVNLYFQNTYTIEEYYRHRNLLQFNIDYQFLKRHRLSFNSFYTIFQDQVNGADLTFSVNYTVNFGIPMKKLAEAGSVSGHIKNLGVETTEGIILYLNGRSRMTDKNGNFFFKNIKPGKYNLLMDRSTLSMYDIIDTVTPIEVNVAGGEETFVSFGITKASKVMGKIALKKSKSSSKLLEQKDITIGHIVLELHRGNESIRIISDGDGSFSFPLVRPGKWMLKVYKNGIDSRLKIAKDHFDLILNPGETKSVNIDVIRKKKTIIFMNNNINLSSGG